MCLPSSCLLQLVGSASGQSSLPACLHSGKSKNEEQKKMGMKPRWRGQSWGWVLEPSRGLGVALSSESPLSHFRPPAGGLGAELGGGGGGVSISGYLQPAAVPAGWGFPQQKPPGGWPQGPQLSPKMFQVVLLLRNPLPRTSRASPGHACLKASTGHSRIP